MRGYKRIALVLAGLLWLLVEVELHIYEGDAVARGSCTGMGKLSALFELKRKCGRSSIIFRKMHNNPG